MKKSDQVYTSIICAILRSLSGLERTRFSRQSFNEQKKEADRLMALGRVKYRKSPA